MNWKSLNYVKGLMVSEAGGVTINGISLHQEADKDGYLRVRFWVEAKRKWFRVHRLVGEAFIDNPEGKPQINHIDGNKQNNHALNLEWATSRDNNQHARRVLKRKGFRIPDKTVMAIRIVLETGKMSQREISEAFGINKETVSAINKGYRQEAC